MAQALGPASTWTTGLPQPMLDLWRDFTSIGIDREQGLVDPFFMLYSLPQVKAMQCARV
jgi:hypothetical protein